MKLTKKEMSKRIEELERRVEELEQRPIVLPTLPAPYRIAPYVPIVITPNTLPTWCDHEFPSHYYSPDGNYPCMKCGKSFLVGTRIICTTTSAVKSWPLA